MKKTNRHIIFVFIILFIGYFLYKNIVGSVFLKKRDRVNVVFFGSNTIYYSLGIQDISYFFTVFPDSEIEVPGGYGFYRIGALGKLVSLEKQKDIFKKTFSAASSSFVDLYFYPKESIIFYSENQPKKSLLSTIHIFTDNSNANLLDRVLLWLLLVRKPGNQFKEITKIPYSKEGNRELFNREEFFKEFQGFFYKKTYRNINDTVQILYTKNYKTALLISNILEGEGIQVVDLSETGSSSKTCRVIYGKDTVNDTTPQDIQQFFGCSMEKSQTDVSDIILVLGNLEKDWEVD
jgi:hypothetical protein